MNVVAAGYDAAGYDGELPRPVVGGVYDTGGGQVAVGAVADTVVVVRCLPGSGARQLRKDPTRDLRLVARREMAGWTFMGIQA